MPKVLPTIYRGTEYRSRTEARWSVFMDVLGIRYQYEPEAIEFDDGTRYLPDFWLPDLRCYLEIKGDIPTVLESLKCNALAEHTGARVFLFVGAPQHSVWPADVSKAFAWIPSKVGGRIAVDVDEEYMWCECSRCTELGIEWHGYAERIGCGCPHVGKNQNTDSTRLDSAYRTAKAERFDWRKPAA